MANTAEVKNTFDPLDQNAALLRAEFNDDTGGAYLQFAHARRVSLRTGPHPSTVEIDIPCAGWEDQVPAVAGIPGGPLAEIKVGDRCLVKWLRESKSTGKNTDATLFVGSVVKINHNLSADGGIVEAVDDKWILEGVSIVGIWIAIPLYSGGTFSNHTFSFKQSGPVVFNPNKRPNCLDVSGYGPMFAPFPDYGWTADDTAEPAPGSAQTKARSWRLVDVLEYLRHVIYSADENFLYGRDDDFKEIKKLGSNYIVWPVGFGTELAKDTSSLDAGTGEVNTIKDKDLDQGIESKAHSLDLDGKNLLSALTEIIEQCGAFGLYMAPGAKNKSIMMIKPMKYLATMADQAHEYDRGVSAGNVTGNEIQDANITLDGSDSFNSVVVRGDPVYLETRVEYDPTKAMTHADQTMLPAWTRKDVGGSAGSTDEELFLDYMASAKVGSLDISKTYLAWQHITTRFPKAFTAYKINPAKNWYLGTKYASLTSIQLPPKVLGHLLSGMSEDGEVQTVRDGSARRFLSRNVTCEVYDDSSQWVIVDDQNIINEVDEEGNFYLNSLRDASLQVTAYAGGGTIKGNVMSAPLTCTPRRIRLTLAFELDREMLASIGITPPKATTGAPAVPAIIADPNSAGFGPTLDRQYVATVKDGYREYLRKDSWPIPEAFGTSDALSSAVVKAPDKCTAGSELMTDEAWVKTHAQRRLAAAGRLKKSGAIVHHAIMPGIAPGRLIKSLGEFSLKAATIEVEHVSNAREQYTREVLA